MMLFFAKIRDVDNFFTPVFLITFKFEDGDICYMVFKHFIFEHVINICPFPNITPSILNSIEDIDEYINNVVHRGINNRLLFKISNGDSDVILELQFNNNNGLIQFLNKIYPEIDGVDDQDIILSLINRYDELINPNTIDYNYDD